MSAISPKDVNKIFKSLEELKSMCTSQQESLKSLEEVIRTISRKVNEISNRQEHEERKHEQREEQLKQVPSEIKAVPPMWKRVIKRMWNFGEWIYNGMLDVLNVVTASITMYAAYVYLKNSH